MMAMQERALIDREVQTSDAKTYVKDLPERGGLSGLDLIFRGTNGATSNIAGWLYDSITKLEIVVNGDVRLWSLSGREAFLWAWHQLGKAPWHKFSEQASAVQEFHIPIRFGRWLGDPNFGLKLSNYESAQLQVQYNQAAVTTVGASGFVTGTFEVSALAHITPPQNEPAYQGLFSVRELESFTSAASGDYNVKLPRNYPISALGIYCNEAGVAPSTNLTHAWLGLKNDTERPIAGRWDHHATQNWRDLIDDQMAYDLLIAAADTKDTLVGTIRECNFEAAQLTPTTTVGDSANLISSTITNGGRLTIAGNTITIDTDASPTVVGKALAANNARVVVRGQLSHLIKWNTGDKDSMSGLLMPADVIDGGVYVTQGNAGATCAVIAEEVRPR